MGRLEKGLNESKLVFFPRSYEDSMITKHLLVAPRMPISLMAGISADVGRAGRG